MNFLTLHFDRGLLKIQHPLFEPKEWNFNAAGINKGHGILPQITSQKGGVFLFTRPVKPESVNNPHTHHCHVCHLKLIT